MSLKRHGDYWYPLSPISAPYWGFRYRCGSLAESESTTFEFAGQVASQYGDWSNRFNWDAQGAAMTCICTPAIAGISDGPNVDCPVHGSIGARHEELSTDEVRGVMTVFALSQTTGMSVEKVVFILDSMRNGLVKLDRGVIADVIEAAMNEKFDIGHIADRIIQHIGA